MLSENVRTRLARTWWEREGKQFQQQFPVSFIVFPGSFTDDPSALGSLSDDQIKTALQPLLANLATAENAADLAGLGRCAGHWCSRRR